ncbi:Mediator of RNA polymerase II transcription subunit 15 [Oopsacas minuta]|uniref:Mediator of RNA polymerase II transcription subunit 15 n=1 Tax=Oopsacas minuta TaxID=111878 RepID=A0AAV7JS35_9METZ|nr:Mediator of RNA polymerase II transcription subunit 15 [Oopsacas minuta]
MYTHPRQPQYDLESNRQMMSIGSMQGMPPDASYHQPRGSMMLGQQGSYAHYSGNHHYPNQNFNRPYRPAQSIHPAGGMGTVMPSKAVMGMGSGRVNPNHMTGFNPAMTNQSYGMNGHYAPHPHQLTQTPQNIMSAQGMGNISMGQSTMMQSYHGSQQGMSSGHAGNSYMLRNSMYPPPGQMSLTQSMGYPTHPQQHPRLSMPGISHVVPKPPLDGLRMNVNTQLQGIKIEDQHPMMGSVLASSGPSHPPIGMSHDTHQPPSNTQLYQQYPNIPSVPNPLPEENDLVKRSKEIVSTFETYRAQNKEQDNEYVKKINSFLPLLKPKQEGLREIIQECEHLWKQILQLTLTDTSINTTSLNFFSDSKFPDNRLPADFTLDIPINRTEYFLKFEIERLDPRIFSVDIISTSNSVCFNLKLECNLKREGLPVVPPLIVKIPADYPRSSPESDLTEHYDSTPFLRQVKKSFVEEMVSVAGEYTVSHLLTCWERVVRNVCLTM